MNFNILAIGGWGTENRGEGENRRKKEERKKEKKNKKKRERYLIATLLNEHDKNNNYTKAHYLDSNRTD